MSIRKHQLINDEIHLLCSLCKQYKMLDEFAFDKRATFNRRSQCKKCAMEYAVIYRKENPEKVRISIHKFLGNNRELCRQRNRQWRLNNPEKQKISSNNWYKRTKNKITECINGRLRECLNGKNKRKNIWDILGYSYEVFTKHIETQFQPGMSWENHGEWEIDHIIPISFFQFESPEDVEFKMCWRLENIQPLWKHQNRQKTNKVLIA